MSRLFVLGETSMSHSFGNYFKNSYLKDKNQLGSSPEVWVHAYKLIRTHSWAPTDWGNEKR